MDNLISVEWLHKNRTNENLIILDASPTSTASEKVSAFPDLCIPNARQFNIKENFSNKESDFPNTVPTPEQFENECQKLGINSDSKLVVYDNFGIYTAPRVWWLFKIMGHDNVSVLNGGLPEWINKKYETVKVSHNKQEFITGNFKSQFNESFVLKHEDIIDNIKSDKFLLVDARSAGRFEGTADEPRKHLQSGSIPNSVNIPFKILLDNGKFKSPEKLKEIFLEKAITDAELAFSCGSGLTACIVMLASEIAFKKSKFLYDGSWTEYAELNNLVKNIE